MLFRHPIEDRPSPNFGPRRDGAGIDMVVLHYTGMDTTEAAIERLADPSTEVSAHYVVCPEGRILRMVAEEMRAWHAGTASWGGVSDVNSRSIGIEIANPGHELGYPPFPEPQMAALEALLGEVIRRYQVPAERVLGHACVAPQRKRDPGEKFDWRRLALGGLSVWLDNPGAAAREPEPPVKAPRFQAAARRFGYGVPESGRWCPATLAVWQAFTMRFLPARAGSAPSSAGIALMEALAARWPCASGA